MCVVARTASITKCIPTWRLVCLVNTSMDFEMRNETMIKSEAKGINWHTALFIVLFSFGGGGRALYVQLAGVGSSDLALVDFRESGGWYGFSPTLDAPRL